MYLRMYVCLNVGRYACMCVLCVRICVSTYRASFLSICSTGYHQTNNI